MPEAQEIADGLGFSMRRYARRKAPDVRSEGADEIRYHGIIELIPDSAPFLSHVITAMWPPNHVTYAIGANPGEVIHLVEMHIAERYHCPVRAVAMDYPPIPQ